MSSELSHIDKLPKKIIRLIGNKLYLRDFSAFAISSGIAFASLKEDVPERFRITKKSDFETYSYLRSNINACLREENLSQSFHFYSGRNFNNYIDRLPLETIRQIGNNLNIFDFSSFCLSSEYSFHSLKVDYKKRVGITREVSDVQLRSGIAQIKPRPSSQIDLFSSFNWMATLSSRTSLTGFH